MAKEETPQFDFGDVAQFQRLATALVKKHQNARRDVEAGKDTHVYRVEVTRVRAESPMSAEQLGYYWAVVMPYAAKGLRETWGDDGIDSNRAHEFFKKELLRRVIVNQTDHPVRGPKGRMVGVGEVVGEWTPKLAELDAADRVHYIDAVILYCAEWLGVAVPPPTRQWADPQLPAPPAPTPDTTIVDVGPGRFQIQKPPARKQLPPGRVSGPTQEDGGDPDDLDREIERQAGTPE